MSTELQIMVDGHVEVGTLRQFADAPQSFDDDSVEAIWQHLDVCEVCMHKFEGIREDRPHTAKADRSRATTPPQTETSRLVFDPGAFNPDEIKTAKIEPQKTDGVAINGWIPVGDDPSRNGVPEEYLTDDGQKTAAGRSGAKTAGDPSPERASPTVDIVDREERAGTPPRTPAGMSGPHTERIELETLTETSRAAAPATSPAGTSRPERARASVKTRPARADSPFHPSAPQERPAKARGTRPERLERGKSQAAVGSSSTRPIPGSVRPNESEPLEELLDRLLSVLARPRNAIVAVVVVVAVVGAVVGSILLRGGKPAPAAGWEPLSVIDTRVPLQEVIVRHALSGRIPAAEGTDVTLDFRGVSKLVIAVDLSWLDRQADYYRAVVRDQAQTTVFDERIPNLYLDDDRFFLRLVPREFQDGQTYQLDILAHKPDGSALKIAESVFDVKK